MLFSLFFTFFDYFSHFLIFYFFSTRCTKQLESNYGYISITQKSDNTSSSSDNFSEEFSELEQVCNNLIDLIVRDFIQSWYTYCCDDKIFLSDCKNLMKLSLQKIFRRCLEIDWNLFFSTVPFEKLLRHINSIRKQRSNPKNAMKNNSSRKKNFVEYFQLVTSAVLAELIPGKLYNIQILHLMLRELVINNVVMPSIEYYSVVFRKFYIFQRIVGMGFYYIIQ